jgi:Fe-S cluster assembly protein SufD
LASAVAEPEFLTARRAQAQELLQSLELPQFKGRPGWEFTDLSDLELSAYQPIQGANGGKPSEARPLFRPQGALELAQVDGRKRCGTQAQVDGRKRYGTHELPAGVIVAPLEQAAREHPELVEPHLGSLVAADTDLFVARNEAGCNDGAFVYVPKHAALERPIVLSAIQATSRSELNRRTLIVLEEGAQAEIWEQHVSSSPELESLLNTVIELAVGAGARLRFICGQELSERSWIFGTHRAEVGRDAVLDWVALGFGSGGGRVRMETRLGGPGAEARVTGAYAARGRQHIDFDTTQEHAAPNTTSDLAFRGVLQGRATAVWKGNIIVDPGAQKTDAFQESRNLLVSKRAHADAIPGLEIQANDVRCTHAAAVAQVDAEQLFYLRSHGLPENIAKRLVIEGFLAALVERFEQGRVRQVLAGALERRLSQILGGQ